MEIRMAMAMATAPLETALATATLRRTGMPAMAAAPAAGTDPYWVILPNGGTKNAGQLLNPIGVTIASMVGRTAAVLQGIV